MSTVWFTKQSISRALFCIIAYNYFVKFQLSCFGNDNVTCAVIRKYQDNNNTVDRSILANIWQCYHQRRWVIHNIGDKVDITKLLIILLNQTLVKYIFGQILYYISNTIFKSYILWFWLLLFPGMFCSFMS